MAAPDGSAFYTPPDPLPDGEHGDLVWSRALAGPAALAGAACNDLVLYRSAGLRDEPIAVSGTVALPPGDAPTGGFPIVGWAHGTVGAGAECAPSRATGDSPMHAYHAASKPVLDAFLDAGFAVVMTDYEGLGTPGPHPFSVGLSQARAVLDGVRAARALHPQLSDRVAVAGHSQGGQAALFAGHHRDWTPELRLVAVAAIAPLCAQRSLVLRSTALPLADPRLALTGLLIRGAACADPSIDPRQLLTDAAFAVWSHVDERCLAGLAERDSWGGLQGSNQLRAPWGAHTTALFKQLDAMHPDLEIDIAIRVADAVADEKVEQTRTTKLVAKLRERNGADRVEYAAYEGVPATGLPFGLGYESATIEADLDPMTAWIAARLAA